MRIIFKLKYRDITRRTILTELPEWDVLAEKLSSIFLVPVANVGVSYVDRDGEEITLNSQEELKDFYTPTYKYGESIRFTVKDLSTSHSMSRDTTSHEFHYPPSFPPGFPLAHYIQPELTLSYGWPPPPSSPLHHYQATHPSSSGRIGHGPHGHREHHRHPHHPPNRPMHWHHQPSPSLPPLNVTLWGPHGFPHQPPPDHFSGPPHPGPPHPGSPSSVHHEILSPAL